MDKVDPKLFKENDFFSIEEDDEPISANQEAEENENEPELDESYIPSIYLLLS